jgi:hypothetical protein
MHKQATTLVLSGRWRTGLAEALLMALVALVAAGVLTAAFLARGAASASAPTLERAIGAPEYVAQVPPSNYRRAAREMAATGDFSRVGPAVPEIPGTLSNPGHNLEADFLVSSGTGLPHWDNLLQGPRTAPGPAAWLELGAARAMGVSAGSTVTMHTATGAHQLRVAGIFGDLSRGEYPINPVADVVLDPSVAKEGALPAPPVVVFGLWTDRPPGVTGPALARALPADGSWSRLASVPGHFAVITDLIIGLLAVFAMAALVALVLLVATMLYLEVLRRERWVGQLRAIGWTAGAVRSLLAIEWAPVTFLGAVGGTALGALFAKPVARPMTQLYGAVPYLADPVLTAAAVVALVVAVTVGTAALATRHIGERAICQQLRSVSSDPPAGRTGRLARGGASLRVGLAMLAGRKRRAVSVASVTFLACLIAVLGSSLSSVAGAVGHNPAVWGFRFGYEVQLPVGTKEAPAIAEARRLPAVGSVSPAYFGAGRVPGRGSTGQILLVSPAFFAPHLEHGRPITGPYQVEVGQELAHLVSPAGVLPMTVGDRTVALHVAGVVQDLFDRGSIVLGWPTLATRLAPDITTNGLFVKCSAAATCPAVGRGLRAADSRAWAVSSARDNMALPFGGSVVSVTRDLFIAFVLLAALAGLYAGLATAGETMSTYGLLRAIGATRSRALATGGVQALAMTFPAAFLAWVGGVPLSHLVVNAASAAIGGLSGTPISLWSAGSAALVVALVACAGVGVPLGLAASRAPVRTLAARL